MHIVSGGSAGGSLRQTLRQHLHLPGKAAVCENYLHAGPLASCADSDRVDWLKTYYFGDYSCGFEDGREDEPDDLYDYLLDSLTEFWDLCLDPEREKVIWFTRRCAADYCMYLEVLRRIGDYRNASIVDLTDMRTEGSDGKTIKLLTAGVANPEVLARHWDERRPLTADDLSSADALWSKLRQQNAPLRVMKDGDLVSAPIDYFDAQILSYVRPKFMKVARIVGDVLGYIDWGDEYAQGLSDLFYFNRLVRMAERGEIEWVGSMVNMRRAEIRRK